MGSHLGGDREPLRHARSRTLSSPMGPGGGLREPGDQRPGLPGPERAVPGMGERVMQTRTRARPTRIPSAGPRSRGALRWGWLELEVSSRGGSSG